MNSHNQPLGTNTPILPKLKTDATLNYLSNRLNSQMEKLVDRIAVR